MSRARRKSIRDVFSFFDTSDPSFHRIAYKNGDTSLKLKNQPSSKICCFPNLFISVVELNKKWITLIFLTCFLLSWFGFAILFFFASEANGDVSAPSGTKLELDMCIVGGIDFQSIFLFSMETQTTIGYGTRFVTEKCAVSIILVVIQSVFGYLILTILTGVVLFKFQEPKKRAHTVLFSKVVCVFHEGGQYFVEIQVLNMQKSQVIEPKLTATCIMNRPDGSGKCRFDMDFTAFQTSTRLFFGPRTYRHLIDTTSPFWDFDRTDFERGVYEIVVTLEGTDEFTHSFTHVRSSYLPNEIRWGCHFKAMTTMRKNSVFKLNFNDFTQTKELKDMTDSSAATNFRKMSTVSYPDSFVSYPDSFVSNPDSSVSYTESVLDDESVITVEVENHCCVNPAFGDSDSDDTRIEK